MISVELKNNELYISPISDVNNALKKMQLIEEKKWTPSIKSWIIPRKKIKDIVVLFGINIKFITPLEECLRTEEEIKSTYVSTDGFEGLKCTLYPFQTVGANFAISKQGGALIADVMGLGKTLQALGAFQKKYNKGQAKTMLVISPASVKYQWAEEVASKTEFKSYVLETPSKFKGKTSEDREKAALAQFDELKDIHVVITNYETLLNDKIFDKICKMKFDILTVDECHSIKNRTAERSKRIYKLAKIIDTRIGLSGTPLENRPPELFGVFQLIEPKLFANWSTFASRYIKFVRYGIIAGYRNLPELREKIQPYIIRRTLKDVSLQMPDKVFSTRIIEMTNEQRKLHDQLYNEIMDDYEQLKNLREKYGHLMKPGADGEYNPDNDPEPIKRVKASIMGKYSFLLECCDSPELINMSGSKMAEKYKISSTESPKLDALIDIVDQVVDQGDKIVIFTQYARMIDIIEDRIEKEFKGKVKIAVIDGSVEAQQRIVEKNRFINDEDCKVMLLSDAGNFGLNLQNANYLVMFEPPLKPSIYD